MISGWRHCNSTSVVYRLYSAISHKNGVLNFIWFQLDPETAISSQGHCFPFHFHYWSVVSTLVTHDSAYVFHHILHQAISRLCSQLSVPLMPKSLATPWLLTLAWMATSATLSSIHLGKESHVSSAWQQCLQQTCPFTQQLWLAECGLYISRVWKRNPFWTKDGPAGCPRYLKASASSK